MRRLVKAVAARPMAFEVVRWVLEAGYRGEKRALRSEGVADAASTLDLGCGTGAMAAEFDPHRYVGVDSDPRYIEHARRTKPDYRFELMDGRCLDFPEGAFDAVLIGGVIHHLDDVDALRLLREARRVLKAGSGRLVMWEDLPTRARRNWAGRLIGRLDAGDFVRPAGRYVAMARSVFGRDAERHYPMASGVCDYVVIVATKPVAAGA